MVNTRKKCVRGQKPEKAGESSSTGEAGPSVQIGEPSNGKQTKISKKEVGETKTSSLKLKMRSPGQKKLNQLSKKIKQS